MRRNILSILTLFVAIYATATDFYGKVVDENGEAIEFATVSLLNTADSTFICGTTTAADGSFSLSCNINKAIARITYIGYMPSFVNTSGDIGTVALTPEESMLSEVAVTATRPTYKLTTEGIKTEVDGTLLSKVGTANKVLENLPGVQKKADGIEVFGKGTPLIYVDGRQLREKGELDQIQSENIKSVELITNPGAKYKANVEAVILIKTKRQQGEGFSFNTTASYFRSRNNDLDLGFDWNYRHRGLDVFGSVWYNGYHNWHSYDITLDVNTDKKWQMLEHSNENGVQRSLYASIGANYIFSDNHAIGFRYDTKDWFRHDSYGTFTADVTADGIFYDHLDNTIKMESKSNMPHTLNAYYNGKVGKTSIDFNTDYMFMKDRKDTWNDETSQEQESRIVTSRSVLRSQLWASKLVLSWSLWGGNLQAGTEYDLTNRNDDYINPEQVVPTSFTEQRERNYTFFTEYSHPLSFGQMRLGLRNENVTSDYYNAGVKIADQSKTYHHFFPSMGLTARLGKMQMMANYSMKIQRPYYWMLNGAITYANRFTWQSGNPMLKPSVINQASLMVMWRWVNVMFDYKRTNDVIVNVGESVEGSPETTLITRDNVDHADAIRAMVILNPKFGIYQPSLTIGMIKDWIKIPSPVGFISPSNPIYLVQFNNSFKITPTFTAQANLSFTSKGDKENMTLTKAVWDAYVSLTKTFFDDRLSLQVAGHNILDSHENISIRYGTRSLFQKSNRDSRELEVTVRYKFNATNSKYRGGGAGDSEKARFGEEK
ncbi:MAG: outer membrane beta-barrel protein [Muribaculaceae bacterium]|nr:outer membrane beta-barrel protein [Muribaculaceae bacterium]